jgi:peroxin-5
MAKWESEFSQLMNAQRDELEDYGKNMQKVYENGFSYPAEDAIQFDDGGIPQLGPYVFGEYTPCLFIILVHSSKFTRKE